MGSFLLLREMARGGTGIIYKARRVDGEELAAVKLARSQSPLERELLRREIAMLLRLGRHRHPGIVRLLEADLEGAEPYYAMELIEGPELAAMLGRSPAGRAADRTPDAGEPASARTLVLEPPAGTPEAADVPAEAGRSGSGSRTRAAAPGSQGLPTEERVRFALEVGASLAQALAFLHAEGVFHADLSPRNVILRHGTAPVLIDFGAALYAGQGAREIAQEESLVAGTPAYMAPERLAGEAVDARCDLYSLGCILHALLCGAPPETPAKLDLGHAGLLQAPAAVRELLGRLLEHDPEDRLATAAEAEAVLARALDRQAGDAAPPRTHLHRPRLVGRAKALAVLIDRATPPDTDGKGARIAVAGEGGIGKTRVLNAFARQARSRGLDVVMATADDRDPDRIGPPALSVFRPLLRRMAHRPANAQGRTTAEALDVLAAYEPSLLSLPDVDPGRPPALPSAAGRRRVLTSLRHLLDEHAARWPVVLLLDDLHRADDLSLAFVESLSPAPKGVLLVCTYRTDESGLGSERAGAVPWDDTVTLGRLELDHLRELARSMLGTPHLPEGLPEFLHRRSGGNPSFATSYLHALLGEQRLCWSPSGGWSFQARGSAELETDALAPREVTRMVQERLGWLSRRATDLLELAAVLGREWPWGRAVVLGQKIGAATAVSPEALEELVARQILEPCGPPRYRFVHDEVRTTQDRRLTAERRRSLHRAMAELLERALAGDERGGLEATPGEIGLHWSRAQEPERAYPQLIAGARQAEATFAQDRAEELYRRATVEARGLPAGHPARTPWLRQSAESLADLLVRMGRHQEARQHLAEALELVASDEPRMAARLHRKIADSHWLVHDYEQARSHLEVAARLLGPPEALESVDDKREWIWVHCGQLNIRYLARQIGPETLALIRALEPMVEAWGAPLQRTLFYQTAVAELMARGRYAYNPEAVTWARKLVAITLPTGTAEERSEALVVLGFALLLGDPEEIAEAVQILEMAVQRAQSVADRALFSRSLTYLCIATRRNRDRERVEQLSDELRTAAEAAKLTPYLAVAEACRGWCDLHRGDAEAALAKARRAKVLWRSSPHAYPFRWLGLFVELQTARTHERWPEMITLARELLEPEQQRLPEPLGRALAELAEAETVDPRRWDQTLRLAADLRFL